MDRSEFLKLGGILAMAQATGLNTLAAWSGGQKSAERMPAIFIGHGNPMNAIEPNAFNKTWQQLGQKLPRPKAILCISAHWLTSQTSVTMSAHPQTIHDFGGFPRKLFEQQYPAPGSPEYAAMAQKLVTLSHVQSDESWGLDHGTWSVLLPMYPMADIPVFQLSIVYDKPLSYHYELGKQLAALREKGVMIIGSGNMVHNLREADWDGKGGTFDWAHEFDGTFKRWIETGDSASALAYKQKTGKLADQAHPTNDHLLPLFYILGARQKADELTWFNEQFDMGSISMRSAIFA